MKFIDMFRYGGFHYIYRPLGSSTVKCDYLGMCMQLMDDTRDAPMPGDDGSAQAAFFNLTRQLAHDFNDIWMDIFRLTQEMKETAGAQSKETVFERIGTVYSTGLLYSRSIMDTLMRFNPHPEVFDACEVIRDWAYKFDALLHDSIDISCLVPPQPLLVRFEANVLRLILLSLSGHALRATDIRRWVMIGMRSANNGQRAGHETTDSVDILFLCRLSDYRGEASEHFLQRVAAVEAVAAAYGGTVKTRIVANVGANVRIRLPRVPESEESLGAAEHFLSQIESM